MSQVDEKDAMTHKEKLTALLDEMGCGYTIYNCPVHTSIYVDLVAHTNTRVVGYSGFECSFEFAADGSFMKASVTE